MKKKLLLMGGRYQTNEEIIAYAKSKGVYTITTDNYDVDQSPSKLLSDEYWMIRTDDINTLEKKCKKENIGAIICGISEFNIEQCIKLSKRLNLPFYCDEESFSYSRDKLKFKKQCQKINVPVASHYEITPDLKREHLVNINYPVVVKPVDRNANRGISFCYNEEELIDAVKFAQETSYCGRVLAERMLIGQEYYANYAISNGEVSFIGMGAMCSEPGYPYNCYSLETSFTKEFYHFLDELNSKLIKLIKSMKCREGYVWFEFILDQDNHFYVLEMGYRLAGTLMHMSQKDVTGFDAIKWLVDYSLGEKRTIEDLPVSPKKPYERINSDFSIWSKHTGIIKKIYGLDELKKIPEMYVSFVAKEGEYCDQYRHIGTVVFSSDNYDDLINKLELIKNTLKVVDENNKDMIIYYTDYDHLKEA